MGNGYRAYYDERTRAFLTERWNTPLGEQVSQEISRGIVNSVDLRFILERYTLQTKIYGAWFPAEYYPHEHMAEGEFWVLHGYDLRGFFFHDINDYRGTASLYKMCLDYAIFPKGTNLSGLNLEMTSLEGTVFYECNLVGTCFAGAGGGGTKFEKSDMRDVLLWDARFQGSNLKGCDLRGAYLEDCHLKDPVLDFRTRFDDSIVRQWENRRIDDPEAARIYRQLADAHRSNRFYGRADTYYVAERRMAREQLRVELREARGLAPKLHSILRLAADYVSDAMFGYGVRPAKIALWSAATIVVFGLLIWFFDLVDPSPSLGSALYTSVLTFATFGLGEQLSPDGDVARGLIALEAILGVLLSTLFIVTFARKIIREQ